MCGAPVWDWVLLDLAYVLALVGGAIVLRATSASPPTWVLYFGLSASVGAFLLIGTTGADEAFGASMLWMAYGGTAC